MGVGEWAAYGVGAWFFIEGFYRRASAIAICGASTALNVAYNPQCQPFIIRQSSAQFTGQLTEWLTDWMTDWGTDWITDRWQRVKGRPKLALWTLCKISEWGQGAENYLLKPLKVGQVGYFIAGKNKSYLPKVSRLKSLLSADWSLMKCSAKINGFIIFSK